MVDFFVDGLGANSSIHKSKSTYDKVSINSDTLNNKFINKKIKLLKIDAEGHELEVLKGGSKFYQTSNTSQLTVDPKKERVKV